MRYVFALILSLYSLVACSQAELNEENEMSGTMTVTVVKKGQGNAVFALVTEQGKVLEPVNLPMEYRLDGTRLRIVGKVVADRASINNLGDMIEISEFELLFKPSPPKPDDTY